MSDRFASLIAASAVALGANAALAQAPAQPPGGTTVAPVTVQAAPPPKTIERQSWDFTQSFATEPNTERHQLLRWRDPVCVKVMGVEDKQAAYIKARIEDVARSVDLHVGKPGCSSNIQIVFTDRPQALMDRVAQKDELILGYYHRHDHDRLKIVTRPVQAWYVTAVQQSHGPVMADPENQTGGCEARKFACEESMYANAFVVADSRALKGKDVGLLSDYLVMLTLGPPRSLDGCMSMPSVIDALSPASCGHDKPDGLTPGDAAYLTALYQANLEYRAEFAETDISRRMARILINANKANAGD